MKQGPPSHDKDRKRFNGPPRRLSRRKLLVGMGAGAVTLGGFTYLRHELSYISEIEITANWREGLRQLQASAAKGEYEVLTNFVINSDGTTRWLEPLKGSAGEVGLRWSDALRAELLLKLGKDFDRVCTIHTHPAKVKEGTGVEYMHRAELSPPSFEDVTALESYRKKVGIPEERHVGAVVDSVGNLWYYRPLSNDEIKTVPQYREKLADYLARSVRFTTRLQEYLAKSPPPFLQRSRQFPALRRELSRLTGNMQKTLQDRKPDASTDGRTLDDAVVQFYRSLSVSFVLPAMHPLSPQEERAFGPAWNRLTAEYFEISREGEAILTPASKGSLLISIIKTLQPYASVNMKNKPITSTDERILTLLYLKQGSLVRLVRPDDIDKEPPCAGPD